MRDAHAPPSSTTARTIFTPAFFVANGVHLVALTANALFILLPLYLKQTGLADWEMGAVMSGYAVAAVVSRPFLGHPMDEWGRKPFILGGLIVSCASALGLLGLSQTPFAHAPLPLALLRFTLGAGVSAYFTAMVTWMADQAPPQRLAEVMGIFGLSGLVTMATGTTAATFVVEHSGFAGLFAAAAVGFALAAALALRFDAAPPAESAARVTPPDATPGPDASPLTVAEPTPEAADARRSGVRESLTAFRVTASKRAMRGPMLAFFMFGANSSALGTFIAPFLKSVLSDTHAVAAFFAQYTLSAAVVRLTAGRVIDRLGHATLVAPALLSLGVGIGLLALTANTATALPWPTLASLGLGLGHGVIYPSVTALTITRVSARERGKATSAITSSGDLGGIVGAVAFGAVATAFGYRTMFIATGACVALSALVFLLLERKTSRA